MVAMFMVAMLRLYGSPPFSLLRKLLSRLFSWMAFMADLGDPAKETCGLRVILWVLLPWRRLVVPLMAGRKVGRYVPDSTLTCLVESPSRDTLSVAIVFYLSIDMLILLGARLTILLSLYGNIPSLNC